MAPIDESATAAAAAAERKRLKKEKKRAREEDAAAEGERKHKKSKSDAKLKIEEAEPENKPEKDKKKKKKRHSEVQDEEETAAQEQPEPEPKEKTKSKKKKDKTEEAAAETEPPKKKKKKSKKHSDEDAVPETNGDAQLLDNDAMDVDAPAAAAKDTITSNTPFSSKSNKKIHQPPDIPANPQFPFFTQTISLYEPIYPVGWATPVTSSTQQHLRPLQNRYVPSLRGVLMDYRNVTLSETPGRDGRGVLTEDNEDAAPEGSGGMVESRAEFAVGFGWITAEVDMFVPSRGAWMEGSVNLQTEGHIGVVCFGKFNASIEAKRLPSNWKWIPNESSDAPFDDGASMITADEHGVVRQIHSTGYWADETGERVTGRIRFRIRNFDVGITGETSYLSLEGTMLDREAEKEVVRAEAQEKAARASKTSGVRFARRRIPDFATTKFEVEKEPQEVEAEPVKEAEEPASGVFRFED